MHSADAFLCNRLSLAYSPFTFRFQSGASCIESRWGESNDLQRTSMHNWFPELNYYRILPRLTPRNRWATLLHLSRNNFVPSLSLSLREKSAHQSGTDGSIFQNRSCTLANAPRILYVNATVGGAAARSFIEKRQHHEF